MMYGPRNASTVKLLLIIERLISMLGTTLNGRESARPSSLSRQIICWSNLDEREKRELEALEEVGRGRWATLCLTS